MVKDSLLKIMVPHSAPPQKAQLLWQNLLLRKEIGFPQIIFDEKIFNESQKAFKIFSHKKHIVHIGIGGSSLGPEMLLSAFPSQKSEKTFYFWNNIDPDYLHAQVSWLEHNCRQLQDLLFYIVSKSGSTAETLAHLALAINYLKSKNVPPSDWKKFIVVCTDPTKSELLDFALDNGIHTLPFPTTVGGRFSVLTPVGIFPSLLAELKAEDFILGAQWMFEELKNPQHALFQLAESLFDHYLEDKNETILMPYSSRLKNLGAWFVQLWAESLGKNKTLNGETKKIGLSPISAIGATDQHSIVQLFCEGPLNKFFLFIEIEKFSHDFPLKSSSGLPSAEKLSPFSMGQLMKAEFEGTKKAISETGAPYAHLALRQLDEKSMGALIYSFEVLTAIVGGLLNIDPFNQPGVEAGKVYAYKFLEELKSIS